MYCSAFEPLLEICHRVALVMAFALAGLMEVRISVRAGRQYRGGIFLLTRSEMPTAVAAWIGLTSR
jgi:hypothetical protein